jgi:hypothetical protein
MRSSWILSVKPICGGFSIFLKGILFLLRFILELKCLIVMCFEVPLPLASRDGSNYVWEIYDFVGTWYFISNMIICNMYRLYMTWDVGILVYNILYFSFNESAKSSLPHFIWMPRFQWLGCRYHLNSSEKKSSLTE